MDVSMAVSPFLAISPAAAGKRTTQLGTQRAVHNKACCDAAMTETHVNTLEFIEDLVDWPVGRDSFGRTLFVGR